MTTASGSGSARSSKAQRSRQTTRSTSGKQGTRQRASTTRSAPAETQGGTRGATVNLPFVTAQFHRPDVHLPGGQDVGSVAKNVRSQLPSREQTLFYGALTLGAAFAVLDWPVALAIGVGSAIAHRERDGQQAA